MTTQTARTAGKLLAGGAYEDLPGTGIREATCRLFDYKVATNSKGVRVEIAPYRRKGEVVAQHLRYPDKEFPWRGDSHRVELFGQHLWSPRPDSSIMLVVTEGERDAMSVAQAQGLRWPVVSIYSGAGGAANDIRNNIEWLEKWPFVVFCFDMDEPGRKAATECAQLLSPGKAKIAQLPLKDANEMLKAGRSKELLDALFNARPYAPEGVIDGADLLEELKAEPKKALVRFPWPGVQEMTGGFWPGTVTMIVAGTNAGKTPLIYNLVHHLLAHGETVGVLHTEQQHREAALGVMQLTLGRKLDPRLKHGDEPGFDEAFKATVGSGRWHYFSVDLSPDELIGKVNYLIKARRCGWIIVDHIHDIVSQFKGDDERRYIDQIMQSLKSLAVRDQVGLVVVGQLTAPEGNKGHEAGAAVSLKQIKGSSALRTVPAVILGYERNLRDAERAKIGALRVLKNRHGGRTGEADLLAYEHESGRLVVAGSEASAYGFTTDDQAERPSADF